MESNVNGEAIIGLFESIADNDEKISSQKGTIKMIQADSNEQFKEFAKENGISVKSLKQGYKYYKSKCEGTDEVSNDDFLTICAMIDLALEKDNEE